MRMLAVLLAISITGCSAATSQEESDQDAPALGTRASALLVCRDASTTGCPAGTHLVGYVENACPGPTTTGLSCEPDSDSFQACGSSCGPNAHPIAFTINAACGFPPDAVQCEANTSAFQTCGLGCPSSLWHIEQFSWNNACDASITPRNQTSCRLHGAESFTMCVTTTQRDCPAHYTQRSKSHTPGCDPVPRSDPSDNTLSCAPAYPYPSRLQLPDRMRGGALSRGTLIMSGASTDPISVDMWSNNPSVLRLRSFKVTLPKNVSRSDFNFETFEVSTPTPVKITARHGIFETSQTITVMPPVAVQSISVPPIPPGTRGVISGTITLAGPALHGDNFVMLTSSDPSIWIGSVTVPENASKATFYASVNPVTQDTPVVFSAMAAGVTQTAALTLKPLPLPPPGTFGPAIVQDEGCNANQGLPAGPVNLPFPLNFYGRTFTQGFININGTLTFDIPPREIYSRWYLNHSYHQPLISLFYSAAAKSGNVSYGRMNFGGRLAFCINWFDLKHSTTSPGNSFQLILVDRGDVNPGDFDIYLNYDRVVWDCRSSDEGYSCPSETPGWFSGSPYDGHGDYFGPPGPHYAFPGSNVVTIFNPESLWAFLDTAKSPYSLSRTSHNSTVPGRHLFQIRNTGGRISGRVNNPSLKPAWGSRVQVCPAAGGPCTIVISDRDGAYLAEGLTEGDYIVTALPPHGTIWLAGTVGLVHVAAHASLTVNVTLQSALKLPPGAGLAPSMPGDNGTPIVNWHDSLALWLTGCAKGTAQYEVVANSTSIASGELREVVAETYSGSVPPLHPHIGLAQIHLTLTCPSGEVQKKDFDIYIDPSGTVRTLNGRPIRDARVTLYRSTTPEGPFTRVPEGSTIMSPTNRSNPDVTNAEGRFGWDVMAGYYVVRAEHPDCVSPSGAPYVESPVLTIPPPVTDLDLRLACPELDDNTPPTSSASATRGDLTGWNNTPVQVRLTATDDGSGVASIVYSLTGAQSGGNSVDGSEADILIDAEGETTLTWYARDQAGNTEESHTLQLRIDKTAPTSRASALPQANDQGWNNTPVTIQLAATDHEGSGVAGISYKLSGAQSEEATLFGANAAVLVSAEGVTTLTWYARDQAGNPEAPRSLDIRIDSTPPTLACEANPAVSFPPNHKLIPVQVSLQFADAASGSAGSVLLTAVKSNQPGDGDIQGWDVGTADTQGLLRVERSPGSSSRRYTLTYRGSDLAGNETTCATTVTVPRDPRP